MLAHHYHRNQQTAAENRGFQFSLNAIGVNTVNGKEKMNKQVKNLIYWVIREGDEYGEGG